MYTAYTGSIYKDFLHWDLFKSVLYRIPIYSWFGLDSVHCIQIEKRNKLFLSTVIQNHSQLRCTQCMNTTQINSLILYSENYCTA